MSCCTAKQMSEETSIMLLLGAKATMAVFALMFCQCCFALLQCCGQQHQTRHGQQQEQKTDCWASSTTLMTRMLSMLVKLFSQASYITGLLLGKWLLHTLCLSLCLAALVFVHLQRHDHISMVTVHDAADQDSSVVAKWHATHGVKKWSGS
jgi:predicted lysophospholipase L1 biosynthesis ABC-type transport system permease subunit